MVTGILMIPEYPAVPEEKLYLSERTAPGRMPPNEIIDRHSPSRVLIFRERMVYVNDHRWMEALALFRSCFESTGCAGERKRLSPACVDGEARKGHDLKDWGLDTAEPASR